MQAEVVLNRQAQALCTFTAPFIPVLHSASTNTDQTSSAPLLESHKSLRFTDWRTKAQRDLRLNPVSFEQGRSSSPSQPPEAKPAGEGVAPVSGDSGGQNHAQGKGSLSRYKRLQPLPLGKASKAMQKFPSSCRTLGRIRPRLRNVSPMTLFQDWGIPK